MNTSVKLIGLIVAVTFLVACQPSKNKLKEQIALSEKETSVGFDTNKLNNLLYLYNQYINDYPQDTTVGEYLFKAGIVSMTLRRGEESLHYFTTLIDRFPQSPSLAEAYYYKAFVLEDVIYDINAAKDAYNDFIALFPNHKLASDAKLSLKYLGMTPDEIVNSFEQEGYE